MILSGLIIGILFGFLLKRSRFCFTGTIRDIYLEKKSYNLVIIFAVIFTQAFFYHLMVLLGLVPEAELLSFSLPAVIIGSFIYGFGAVMMNGCMTASLVKAGDGRIIGFASILAFIGGTYLATNSFLRPVTDYLDMGQSVFEKFYYGLPKYVPVVSSLIICVLVYIIMFIQVKKNKLGFKLPQQYTGIRHILFEKIWSKEVAAIAIGVLMAAGFYFHNLTGTNAGFAISTPILTWANECGANIDLSGGWAAGGQGLGWGSLFVLGIVIGSFLTTFFSKEFSIVKMNKKVLIRSIIGSVLMGFGARWAAGCIIGNGMVATAQWSLRGWIALAFLAMGIWLAAYLFIARDLRKNL